MKIHLLDGTYELFRHYYGAPSRTTPDGREIGAVVGLLQSLLTLLAGAEVTYLACAFDSVIESFRNDLYEGYKTGEGVDPDLLAQFPLAEQAAEALGITVWRMIEFEADDALATAAAQFREALGLDQILIASPDKDLAQCVDGDRIVTWDRRRDTLLDAAGVRAKFGVEPASIPDWLALVGDSADGYPGIPGWGAKSAAAVLSRFGHIEAIPLDPDRWGLPSSRAARLGEELRGRWEEVLLYRTLATLRTDVPLGSSLEDLEWRGATESLRGLCREWAQEDILARIPRWREIAPDS